MQSPSKRRFNGKNTAASGQKLVNAAQTNPTKKLNDLLKEIDHRFNLHPDVAELLLEMTDDFIDSVTNFSCKLAKHRRSTVLEAKDLQFCLEKNWGITVPGVAGVDSRALSLAKPRHSKTSIHSSRLAAKKKAIAKMTKISSHQKNNSNI